MLDDKNAIEMWNIKHCYMSAKKKIIKKKKQHIENAFCLYINL